VTEQFTDDPDILTEDCLLRRIPLIPSHIIFDKNKNCWRPSSASFQDHPDGSPMSISIEKELIKDNRTAKNALDGYPGCALASITAGQAREQSQIVAKQPILPKEPAHGVVVGEKKKAKSKFAKTAKWVIEPTKEELEKIELERKT